MTPDHEQRILDTYRKNADPWTSAVRGRKIASRVETTDHAIVQTLLDLSPKRVLDIGCGEGWLSRRLSEHGIDTLGVDAEPRLIAAARESGGGEFLELAHDQLTTLADRPSFDAAVANFSLLGDDSTRAVFRSARGLLAAGGALVVQTLHPLTACGDGPYQDGWREGSWTGCGEGFRDPAPWYFRTLAGWTRLIQAAGYTLADLREPLRPADQLPASLILVAARAEKVSPQQS